VTDLELLKVSQLVRYSGWEKSRSENPQLWIEFTGSLDAEGKGLGSLEIESRYSSLVSALLAYNIPFFSF